MIADHSAEPPALLASVSESVGGSVGDIRRRSDADGDVGRIAPCGRSSVAHGTDRPFGDRQVGQLQDVAITDLAGECQRLGTVCRDPELESAADRPREAELRALVVDAAPVGQFADDMHGLAQGGQRRWCPVGDSHRRVTAADAAHRAVAVHLIERCVETGRDGPVACRRVGHHRPDDDLAGLGEDLAEDDVRLFPQDVRVERPDMGEAIGLSALRQIDHPRRRRCRLQHHSKLHP